MRVQIVEALGVPRVIFLPDEYLAKYVASKTSVEIVAWKGHCEVHERFSGADVRRFREGDPSLVVLAHPECPPDVLAEADYVGSTQGMTEYVGQLERAREAHAPRVLLMTECSMADNVSGRYPSVEFVRPCNLCPHMKRNTLPKVLHSLAGDGVRSHDRAGGRTTSAPRRRADARVQPAAARLEAAS